MRVALPIGRRWFVAVAVLVALVVALPARVVVGALDLDALGFAAREVNGPVWRARAAEAQLAGLPLGDLRIGLHALPLLVGRATLGLSGADGARGRVTVTRHTTAIMVDGWRIATATRFAPLPVTALAFDGVRAEFRDGLCQAAEGGARAELGGDPLGLGLPATLAGPVRCEGGALVLLLAGPSRAGRLRLRFPGGGRYRAELAVRPDDLSATARLIAAGFARDADGDYALAIDGDW